METDKTTRINNPEEEPERRTAEPGAEERAEIEEPQATGFGARFRQLIDQAKQGESRPNIKRQQLKQDRTKSFLMLAGSMVVMALLFFAMFSSPSSTRRNNSGRPNTPNLGRGPNGGKSFGCRKRSGRRNPRSGPTRTSTAPRGSSRTSELISAKRAER